MATWFTVQGSDVLTAHSRGALPCDPEADLLFTVLATRVLNEIHEDLVAEGLTLDLPPATFFLMLGRLGTMPLRLRCMTTDTS